MYNSLEKKSSSLIFVIILLLHITFLLFLFFSYHSPSNEITSALAQMLQPKEHDSWKAMYGQSGAPVIFQSPSPAAQTSQQQPDQNEYEQPTQDSSTPPAPANKKPEIKQQDLLNDHSEMKELEITDPMNSIIEDTKSTVRPELVEGNEHINKTENSVRTLRQAQGERENKKINLKKESQQQQTEQPTIEQSIAQPSAPQQQAMPASPPAQKQTQNNLTLAQLAAGFAQHIRNEGTDAFSSSGSAHGRVSTEQIMFARYNSKISECLTNSLRIHRDKFYLTQNKKVPISVFLEVGENGIIQKLDVVESSGLPYVDKFMLFIFRDAASSFPPLPHYFKGRTFKTVRAFPHAIASIKNPHAGRWAPIR